MQIPKESVEFVRHTSCNAVAHQTQAGFRWRTFCFSCSTYASEEPGGEGDDTNRKVRNKGAANKWSTQGQARSDSR